MPDLRSINRFPSLVKYLRDELDWPIESDDFEDLVFDFTPEELGIDKKNAAKIEEIKRLRPLSTNQPWGIFFVKFDRKKLPVVALRRLLNAVALKKRASANKADQAAWHANDLLFISTYGEEDDRKICFANFSQDEEKKDLPVLKVLGWDDKDTALHLDDVAKTLENKFTWDEDFTEDPEQWGNQWRSAFSLAHGEVVQTSKDMAIQLAHLAQKIRNRINEILAIENDKGPITSLMAAFSEALIDDLDEDGFADMYAQTIAYGLLSARITNPSGESADDLPTAMPITNPFLKELMEQFLQVGGRKKGKKLGTGIDFDELGVSDVIALLDAANMEAVLKDFGDQNPQEDPVIHFFEGFLKEYDSQIRKDRGVFYTPRPVVSFIVRSVDELLRTEFGLEDGLADTTTWGEMVGRIDDLEIPDGAAPDQAFVQILDPATGTGTFLVEVIDLIHKTMEAKWQAEGHGKKKIENLWNAYVPEHLLPRLHGYELMMAPYAIAHMKIGLKLYETGYRFESDERARVYLTNALEPAQDFSGTLAFAIPALAHEAEAVNAIKRDQRFTVVIGNPPYSVSSSNMGSWIVELCKDYKRAVSGNANIQPLSDDYLKFMRFFQKTIDDTDRGVVGVITNNVFLDGLMHRGVRTQLLEFYSKLCIVNLHGNTTIGEQTPSKEKDENVFDIKQGVCISLFSRSTSAGSSVLSSADLYGSRLEKYQSLNRGFCELEPTALNPADPHNFFVAKDFSKESEYRAFIPLAELMPVHVTGVATHRDSFLVDIDPLLLQKRIETFCDLSVDEVGAELGLSDTRDWSISAAKEEVCAFDSRNLRPYAYKPFSRHYIYYDQRLIDRGCSRIGVMRSMFEPNLALVIRKKVTDPEWRHVFVTRDVVDFNFYNYISVAFPLHVQGEGDHLFAGERSQNLSPRAAACFSRYFSSQVGGVVEGALDCVPKSVLGYFYAIMHSPSFRKRYSDFLRIDFPSIPIPKDGSLAKSLAVVGQELVALHVLEAPTPNRQVADLVGHDAFQVEKVSYSDETVWIDKAKTRGFKGVPEEVWNFHIGGYQVCAKWLKDRQAKGGKNPRPGRVLTDEDIEHYQKIVVALSETIRIMAEIDEVIEAHGGWPGAFQTGDAESVNEES
ncbi:N-6 DNA methylase [Akkermansiaceae bacterium]|nr:N-6 DNA methylase [Akkermansiaceae bacterium]